MMMPAIVAATTGVAPRNAGVASGLLNMCRQLGAALGLAAVVTIASSVTHGSRATGSAAVVDGYRFAFFVVAVISVVAAALSLLMKGAGASRSRQHDEEAAHAT
jgi:MFS family permease